MPPVVTTGLHSRTFRGALHNDNVLDGRTSLECLVGCGLQVDQIAATLRRVLRDKTHGTTVIHTLAQSVGAEAAKDDIMGGTDTCTCEHGYDRFRDHTHVDSDNVTAADAELRESIGHATHVGMQLLIGQGSHLARLRLPDDGGLRPSPRIQMSVQTVHGCVDGTANEPLRMGMFPGKCSGPGT